MLILSKGGTLSNLKLRYSSHVRVFNFGSNSGVDLVTKYLRTALYVNNHNWLVIVTFIHLTSNLLVFCLPISDFVKI